MKLVVAGGAGFIGSNFVKMALSRWPGCHVTVFDKLNYAGNLENLISVQKDPRFRFVRGDICMPDDLKPVLQTCTHVVNFAAETHVDRSILDPDAFLTTNVLGTRVLLEGARLAEVERYLQVSTDEVYGDVTAPHRATETDRLIPRSPYAASKAGGDLLVNSYHSTYGLATVITRGANTYGPYQYPEKLLSLFITNAMDGLPLPVYGDGMQMRDWLHVDDHCAGIATALERGRPGGIYNLGTGMERPNIEIIRGLLQELGGDDSLMRFVADRPGHDRRYAMQMTEAAGLGWHPEIEIDHGLRQTVKWYQSHRAWWEPLKDGDYHKYYEVQYGQRLRESMA